MSYILDALRKSESERHQGQVPNLGTNPMLIHAGRSERALWPYILAGGLFLNAAVLGVWFYHSQGSAAGVESSAVDQKAIATSTGTTADTKLPAVSEAPAPMGVQTEHHNAGLPDMPPVVSQGMAPHYKPDGAGTPARPFPGAIPGLSVAPADKPVPDAAHGIQSGGEQVGAVPQLRQAVSSPGTMSDAERMNPVVMAPDSMLITPESARLAMAYDPELGYMDDTAPGAAIHGSASGIRSLDEVPPDMPAIDVPYLDEMPAEFRRRVPTLRFNSHIYSSDPTARRIMVNNVYLRQGQPFAGMTVQEITEDGAIFVLDGVMFSVNAARDWVN